MKGQPMTRRDWWLGIAIVVLALVAVASYIARGTDEVEDAQAPRLRPLGAMAEVRPRYLPNPDEHPMAVSRRLLRERHLLTSEKH